MPQNLELKHKTKVPDILEVLECILRILLFPVGVEARETCEEGKLEHEIFISSDCKQQLSV